MLAPGFHPVPPGHLATVVTHLEMSHRPAPRPAPEGLGLSLRPLDGADLKAYRALFRRVGTDWLWQSRLRLDDAALGAILGNADVEALALRRDGEDAGLLELDFRAGGDAAALAFFGVAAPLQGTGAARWMMNAALDRLFARARRVTLHTCTLDHPAAPAFYRRSGFRAVRQEVEVLPDPRLDGTLSREAGPHVPLAPTGAPG
jgi:GNAT superfamily N-acetyltransferase